MTRPSEVEVSVIIPVRGASASLAVQLSVLGAPPFVLVLVDNGRNGDLRGACLRRVRDGGCCGLSGKRRVVTASSGPRADAVGRLFGLVVGRVWFRAHRRRRPAPSAVVPEMPKRTDECVSATPVNARRTTTQ
ncbi:hypothetical protein WDY66_09975 [Dermacoccus nishinomiyaensis]|uniref:hypothetical protein n=1 Tax=Dermacoccus nishinomiyaensis TaxID=1274 RepID=UPI0030CD2FDF